MLPAGTAVPAHSIRRGDIVFTAPGSPRVVRNASRWGGSIALVLHDAGDHRTVWHLPPAMRTPVVRRADLPHCPFTPEAPRKVLS